MDDEGWTGALLIAAALAFVFGLWLGVRVGNDQGASLAAKHYPCAVKCGGWENARMEGEVCFCETEVPRD